MTKENLKGCKKGESLVWASRLSPAPMKAGAVDGDQRAVGIEMNGHVWDGGKWVPIPPRPASSGRQHIPPSGGSGAPPFQI